jgi:hypothetical protein
MDFEWIKDVICCTKQARWMGESKVVPDYKLEHTNKELDGRLTSLLLLARFFSSALMLLCCFVTTCSMGFEMTRISANGNPTLSTSVVVPGGLPRAIPVSAMP